MVHLTRINRIPLVLNSDLIQHIHSSVDTVVTLTSGENIRVLETPEEIVERIIEFRRRVFAGVLLDSGEINERYVDADRFNVSWNRFLDCLLQLAYGFKSARSPDMDIRGVCKKVELVIEFEYSIFDHFERVVEKPDQATL